MNFHDGFNPGNDTPSPLEQQRLKRQLELSQAQDSPYRGPQPRRTGFPKLSKKLIAGLLALVILASGGFALYKFGPRLVLKAISVVNPVRLKGEDRDHTNFLLMGMTQDGLRTDSIIVASYYYKENKLVTLNIPRDLYANDGYEYAKFGELYSYAKARQPDNKDYPDQYVSQFVSQEYGIPIDYWAEFNMQGEVDLINDIGGVDINVPDAFTDYQYPTWNYSGYVRPAPHFDAGPQHMDGQRALIFSRSRHSLQNGEGSDFARSRRQALVIQAILAKVKGQGIVGNTEKLNSYLSILNKNAKTNMSVPELLRAVSFLQNFSSSQDYLAGNWSNQTGFLCDSTNIHGSYVLRYGVPGDCSDVAGVNSSSSYRQQAVSYIQNLLQSVEPKPTASPTPSSASGQ